MQTTIAIADSAHDARWINGEVVIGGTEWYALTTTLPVYISSNASVRRESWVGFTVNNDPLVPLTSAVLRLTPAANAGSGNISVIFWTSDTDADLTTNPDGNGLFTYWDEYTISTGAMTQDVAVDLNVASFMAVFYSEVLSIRSPAKIYFQLMGNPNAREFHSYDGNPSKAARLILTDNLPEPDPPPEEEGDNMDDITDLTPPERGSWLRAPREKLADEWTEYEAAVTREILNSGGSYEEAYIGVDALTTDPKMHETKGWHELRVTHASHDWIEDHPYYFAGT
jgi:hypothetical protein